jgi:hypothetical protein
MKPAPVDLPIIWRGCDWAAIVLRWKDGNGDPINLTGWIPYAFTNEFDLHASINDVTQGVTQMTLNTQQTAILKLGVYHWNWIWSYPPTSANLPPLLAGKVEVKEPTAFNPP